MNIEYIVICITSLVISIITLFSGFGLGTVLMPVFAIFFPLPIAIASTAVIHLANNLFKTFLVGKFANLSVVIKFGIPGAIAAAIGAYMLSYFASWPPLWTYQLFNTEITVTIIGLMVGSIILFAAIFELLPRFSNLAFDPGYIPLGGILSGFFGGVSGNQGVLRSAFLIRSGLTKEEFIGTGVVCSVIVDVVRIIIYGWAVFTRHFAEVLSQNMIGLVIAASLTAFIGSYIGAQLAHKVTFRTIQIIVGVMLLFLGFGIMIGIA